MGEAGLLRRQDMQFIWRNEGYQTFDDFLAALSSNRRKTIRRERRDAQAGLDIRVLTGADITEAHWDAFFDFYQDTGARKWGRPYLTRDVLQPDRRRPWPTASPWSWPSATARRSPGP